MVPSDTTRLVAWVLLRIFKTKPFSRFAKREKISDAMLYEAVERAEKGILDADLGGNIRDEKIIKISLKEGKLEEIEYESKN